MFKALYNQFFGNRTSGRRTTASRVNTRLRLEALEAREVPCATGLTVQPQAIIVHFQPAKSPSTGMRDAVVEVGIIAIHGTQPEPYVGAWSWGELASR